MGIPTIKTMGTWLASLAVVLAVGASSLAIADGGAKSAKEKAMLEGVKGDKCVAPTEDMRRNHMKYLKHHRDETMHQGIRTTQFSLKGCVECHASPKNNSVVGTNDNFCQGCHVYAGVKLDCFECHATKPKASAAFHPIAGQAPGLAADMRKEMGGASQPNASGAAQ
jgi:predicted CXXCH cytochrome family protein